MTFDGLEDRSSSPSRGRSDVRRLELPGLFLSWSPGPRQRSLEEQQQRLTESEREVLAPMAEGRSNTAIAASLFVTDKAIGKHTSNILAELDLPATDNRRVLTVVAYLQGS